MIREWAGRARSQLAAGSIDLPSLAIRAWPDAPPNGSTIALAVLGVAFAATLAWRRRPDLALVSFCSFAAAVFTYHRPYDQVLLIVPLAYFVDLACLAQGRSAAPKALAASAFAALLLLPNPLSIRGLARFEGAYDALFLAIVYAYLAGNIALLATDRDRP